MSNEELMFNNIQLKEELHKQQAKINKFLSYLKNIEIDIPETTHQNSILELNLIDDLKDIIKESNKLRLL